MLCSLDNAHRSLNERIRLRLTTNVMESGSHDDFRVCALDYAFGPKDKEN